LKAVLRANWAVESRACHDNFLTCDKAYLSACRQPGLSDTPDDPGMRIYSTAFCRAQQLFCLSQLDCIIRG
jgi:hypothetical protein